MGAGKSRPLDTDPRCETLAPIWGPFVDAFVDTLHANGQAVHPPPPRKPHRAASRSKGKAGSDDEEDVKARRLSDAHALRSPGSPGPVFRPAAERLVAIGDLHGDLAKTTEAFRAGGLIDGSGAWIGGSTVAVQVGDQLDRGGDEVAILHMLERLRKEACDAGGELIVMNGNHETLNVAGRFRYAFEPGVEDFRRWRGRQLMGAALKAKCGEKPGGCTIVGAAQAALAVDRKAEKNGEPPIRGTTGLKDVPAGAASGRMYADTGSGCTMPRLAALAPGGPMAIRFLAHQPVTVAVGFVNHLLEFFVRHVFTQFLGDAFQVLEGDLSSFVVIEQSERLHDFFSAVAFAHLGRHHGEELLEVDGAVTILIDVRDHLLDFILVRFETKSTHRNLKFLRVDGSAPIGVKQVKRFANLLLLLFRQPRGASFTLARRSSLRSRKTFERLVSLPYPHRVAFRSQPPPRRRRPRTARSETSGARPRTRAGRGSRARRARAGGR